jgi:transposase-like protein
LNRQSRRLKVGREDAVGSVPDHFRDKMPKLATCMDGAENDVLAFMTFPRAHWAQIYSTNPLERLNAEIKLRGFEDDQGACCNVRHGSVAQRRCCRSAAGR